MKQLDGLTVFFSFTGGFTPPKSHATRAFTGCYWIFAVAMAATYTGTLVAFMTVKKVSFPIVTLEDLVAHPEYEAGFLGGVALEGLFRVSLIVPNLKPSPILKFGSSNFELASIYFLPTADFKIGDNRLPFAYCLKCKVNSCSRLHCNDNITSTFNSFFLGSQERFIQNFMGH